jgi:ketosteroid isomerase-like protein
MVEAELAAGSEGFAGGLALVDFLTDLRAELALAQSRAGGASLKLGVDEVTVSLEVAFTTARRDDGSGKVSAKFWVLGAEAGGTAERSSQRVRTQQLTLTLKPRVESVTVDQDGRVQVVSRGVDVAGTVVEGEEFPDLPPPPAAPGG